MVGKQITLAVTAIHLMNSAEVPQQTGVKIVKK